VPNKRGHAADKLLVGRTDGGRPLTLVLTYLERRRLIRFITGWDCTAAERSKYLSEKGRA